jgi:hypothetical protein
MPEFHAMEPEHRAWKEQVLNREIELEEIDTTPYRERIVSEKGSRSTALLPRNNEGRPPGDGFASAIGTSSG